MEGLFKYDDNQQLKLRKELRDSVADLGYDTHNSILNLGSVSIFFVCYLIGIGLLLFLKIVIKCSDNGFERGEWLYDVLY